MGVEFGSVRLVPHSEVLKASKAVLQGCSGELGKVVAGVCDLYGYWLGRVWTDAVQA